MFFDGIDYKIDGNDGIYKSHDPWIKAIDK
jgi:hypothetical protein